MDTYSFPVEWDLSFINTFNSFVFQHPTQVSWFVIRPCLFANWHPSKLRLLSSWRNWDIGVLSETEIQEFYPPWWLHLSGMAPWFFFKKIFVFIWLCQVLVVAWGIFDLSCNLQDLFICGIWTPSCGMFPDQGWNPDTLSWEHGILTTGLPGKSWLQASKIFLDCKTGKMLFERFISQKATEIIYNYMFSKVKANQGLELEEACLKFSQVEGSFKTILVIAYCWKRKFYSWLLNAQK